RHGRGRGDRRRAGAARLLARGLPEAHSALTSGDTLPADTLLQKRVTGCCAHAAGWFSPSSRFRPALLPPRWSRSTARTEWTGPQVRRASPAGTARTGAMPPPWRTTPCLRTRRLQSGATAGTGERAATARIPTSTERPAATVARPAARTLSRAR